MESGDIESRLVCLFCDADIPKSTKAFDEHLLNHQILKNKPLFHFVSFLNDVEREDLLSKLASKLEKTPEQEHSDSSNEVEDLNFIQSQLEYDSDSTDEEEETRRTEAIDKDFDIIELLGESDEEDTHDATLSEKSSNQPLVTIKKENIDIKQEEDEPDTDLTEEDINSQDDEEEMPETAPQKEDAASMEVSDQDEEAAGEKESPPEARAEENLVQKFKNAGLCKLCYMSYPTEEGMKRHEEVVHKDHPEVNLTNITINDLKVTCQWCPKVKFLSESIMISHAKIDHKKTVKPSKPTVHECKVCQTKIKGNNMKKHMIIHAADREFVHCNLCYSKYTSSKVLKNHIEKIHADDAEFLNRKIEEDEKIYPCELTSCNLRFVSTNSARHHHKKVHTVQLDKPTSCHKN